MLKDYRGLATLTVKKFLDIEVWPEISFDNIDKQHLEKIKEVAVVNDSSIQFNTKDNHCIIPSQYILYAICIKEFAIALREHLDVFDKYKEGKDSNTIGDLISNKSFNTSLLKIDEYSKSLAFKPLIDGKYHLGAKSIVNGTSGKYKIRGTSDFFQSVILKVINVPDASSQMLGKFIYRLTGNLEVYNHLEKKFISFLPYIVKETATKYFAKDVLSFLYQYDGFSVIYKYLQRNTDTRNMTLSYEGIRLTSLFRVSKTILTEADLTMGENLRFFVDPIGTNKDGEYLYLSTEWTNNTGSRLDIVNLKKFIEAHYREFVLELEDKKLFFIPKKQSQKNKLAREQVPFEIESFKESTILAGLNFSEKLITRFISSLCTKPFVLLSGLSGSGKTKLAQCFAKWICDSESQYKIVSVGADWTNREPLLGFPNALNSKEYIIPENGVLDLLVEANKDENSDKPYFLILDEMNLSHVERYFADFLSAMESNESISLHSSKTEMISSLENGEKEIKIPNKICLPSNLFIIGTVNIDETTYMFSPKVLDRANTIEFRLNEDDIEGYLNNPTMPDLEELEGSGVNMAMSFLKISKKEFSAKASSGINKILVGFFGELKKSGAEFGYRTAGEIYRLINQLGEINSTIHKNPEQIENTKLDIAIMQKLLPKVHGSRRKLEPILITLGGFCVKEGIDVKKNVFDSKDVVNFSDDSIVKFPLSLEKIVRMYKGAIDNGFASYAEA